MNFKEVSQTEIELMGELMVLLPEAAIFLPQRSTLLIADLHLGKVEHFRKNGIGIPGEVSDADIDILHTLISTYLPNKVIFLGDLFHSEYNSSWEKFTRMITSLDEVDFHLVVGNHDILSHDRYANIQVSYQYTIGDIVCTHEPMSVLTDEKYNLCGHIHPGVKLRGKGLQYLRLPCYYFGAKMGIMPAFGTFTGTYLVKPVAGDKVFVLAERQVSRVH